MQPINQDVFGVISIVGSGQSWREPNYIMVKEEICKYALSITHPFKKEYSGGDGGGGDGGWGGYNSFIFFT